MNGTVAGVVVGALAVVGVVVLFALGRWFRGRSK